MPWLTQEMLDDQIMLRGRSLEIEIHLTNRRPFSMLLAYSFVTMEFGDDFLPSMICQSHM